MPIIRTFAGDDELLAAVAEEFVSLVDSRSRTAPLRIALTGGTLGIALLRRLNSTAIDLSGIDFYWGDERWVDLDHADRNESQALEAWPELLKARLHRFSAPGHSSLHSAAQAMDTHYQESLERDPNFHFDLVLLGVGQDGHVASLFPDHGEGHGQSPTLNGWALAESNSPKPPAERLSFSYRALNAAERVWFLASGEAKAPSVALAINEGSRSNLPCALVQGRKQTVWFIDQAIADQI